jgi:hypothetical protein
MSVYKLAGQSDGWYTFPLKRGGFVYRSAGRPVGKYDEVISIVIALKRGVEWCAGVCGLI